MGFDSFALSLSKGRSWFDKFTTNDPAYLFSFIVGPMVIGMNEIARSLYGG